MHELGVVFYIIKGAHKVAEENGIDRLASVTVEVGEVTGVIHHYLIDCWNWARKKDPITEDAELIVEQIDAVTYCEDCGKEYPTVKHGKICPYCGSEHTYLIQGSEFILKEVAVKEESEDPPATGSA